MRPQSSLTRRARKAATSIEYALIAGVVSVGIIVSLNAFAGALSNLWLTTASTVVQNID
ncbi:MAG: Flp family type IVb pilin [Myxococcota bacterium]|nr:Flp family type IVb pilin [Myxococcota bacterium]